MTTFTPLPLLALPRSPAHTLHHPNIVSSLKKNPQSIICASYVFMGVGPSTGACFASQGHIPLKESTLLQSLPTVNSSSARDGALQSSQRTMLEIEYWADLVKVLYTQPQLLWVCERRRSGPHQPVGLTDVCPVPVEVKESVRPL